MPRYTVRVDSKSGTGLNSLAKSVGPEHANARRKRAPLRRCDPAGVCVYCGATEDLRDEHVVADVFAGDVLLPQASCVPCGTLTSGFEQRTAAMFGSLRARENIVGARNSRGHQRKLKRHIVIPVKTAEGVFAEQVPESALPATMPWFHFLPPGMLRGVSADEGTWVGARLEVKVDAPRTAPVDHPPIHQSFDIDSFALTTAKIAHCVAVAEFGVDAFEPLVPSALRDPSRLPFIVGGVPESDLAPNVPKGTPGPIHELQWKVADIAGRYFVQVMLRLFAPLGGPTQHVIVGDVLRVVRDSKVQRAKDLGRHGRRLDPLHQRLDTLVGQGRQHVHCFTAVYPFQALDDASLVHKQHGRRCVLAPVPVGPPSLASLCANSVIVLYGISFIGPNAKAAGHGMQHRRE